MKMSERPPPRIIHLPKVRMLGRLGRIGGIRITNIKTIKPVQPAIRISSPQIIRPRASQSTPTPNVSTASSSRSTPTKQPSSYQQTPTTKPKPSSTPLPIAVNPKQSEEDKLRAQLQKEIEWRSKQCAHRGYECMEPVILEREYCLRHILQDSTAPYKQCSFTYTNGKKCLMAAPIPLNQQDPNKQLLCYEHALAALSVRQRCAAPPAPVITTETLITNLQHYVKPLDRQRTTSSASAISVVSDPGDLEPVTPNVVDPFKHIDATAVNNALTSSILECASASDSDADSVTLGQGGTCRAFGPSGLLEDTSDEESTPYELHPLRHAGVFTVEEAVGEAQHAMQRLQAAYTRQLDRLRWLLRAARARYLRALRHEREHNCSIFAQVNNARQTARERRRLRKLKAYAGAHRKFGADAILARKLHRKRLKANESYKDKSGHLQRCTYSDGSVRCTSTNMPAAKFCLKHIVRDPHQVLFVACGDDRAGIVCQEPVPQIPMAALVCKYHADPPPYTVFALKKDDSDTDSEVTHTASDINESHFSDFTETDLNPERSDIIVDCFVPPDNLDIDALGCD